MDLVAEIQSSTPTTRQKAQYRQTAATPTTTTANSGASPPPSLAGYATWEALGTAWFLSIDSQRGGPRAGEGAPCTLLAVNMKFRLALDSLSYSLNKSGTRPAQEQSKWSSA
jgi:hypothetical protein